jgi:hypothetical protein
VGTRRAASAIALGALVLAATGCWQPFDFDDDHRADFIAIASVSGPGGNVVTYRNWDDGTVLAEMPDSTHDWWGAPADYDGDGAYDFGFVDVQAGLWATGTDLGTVTFPAGGAPPCADSRLRTVPADYTGDRKADPAYYCGADATWYIAGRDPVVFGDPMGPDHLVTGEDIAVPEDYDGDQITDLAVYNPVTRSWRVLGSRTGVESEVFLDGNDHAGLPVPADYLGLGGAQRSLVGRDGWVVDGMDEPLDFPAGLDPDFEPFEWYDLAVPADHDGDNIADLTRTSGWTVLHSMSWEDPENPDSRPWDERDAQNADEETRPMGPIPGFVVPVTAHHHLDDLAILTFYANALG